MDSDKTQRDPFIQVVEDHLASGDPPDTKAAYDKLLAAEKSPSQAKALLAGVVRKEMQLMMSSGSSFDNARYKAAIDKLISEQT